MSTDPSDMPDPTGLCQAFKAIAYNNPDQMPEHITPEQITSLRAILAEVQEWL